MKTTTNVLQWEINKEHFNMIMDLKYRTDKLIEITERHTSILERIVSILEKRNS